MTIASRNTVHDLMLTLYILFVANDKEAPYSMKQAFFPALQPHS